MAGLLLFTVLTPSLVPAQTDTDKAGPSPHRWLLIVETSRSMQRRSDAVVEAVQDLLSSGMAGQLRQGDTLGVWTFNDDLYAGRFPLQIWSSEAQKDIASRMLTFLKGQKYEKRANFDKVLPALNRVISDSRLLTVVLISSGDEKMRGTSFDAQINEFCQKWHDQQQKARLPFVIVLRAMAGQLTDCSLNTPPFPPLMPRLPQETQRAATTQEKLLQALHNPSPPVVPPLIISGRKPQPEKAPAPKPQPTVVKADTPAPVVAALNTNVLPVKPVAPAAPLAQTATTQATPVMPAKPPAEVAPKPSPVPVPVTEPKAEVAKRPEPKPVEPALTKIEAAPIVQAPPAKPKPIAVQPPKPVSAPEPKPTLATVPVLPPPATQQVSASALRTLSAPLAPPPSSKPTPPAQTAIAVPAETLAGHRSIWFAGLVAVGVAAGFAFLLMRRSRSAPQASLITRSFERKNKP
jgi:hypothetical protein